MVISAVVFVVQRNVFHLSFIVAAHVRLSDQYGIFMHQRAVDFFSRHFNSYRLIYTKIIHFCIVCLRYSYHYVSITYSRVFSFMTSNEYEQFDMDYGFIFP